MAHCRIMRIHAGQVVRARYRVYLHLPCTDISRPFAKNYLFLPIERNMIHVTLFVS